MNELKPCPFCGGEAEILTAESMHGGYLFGIMCNDCRSRGDVFDTEAEAIAAWNTRAELTCHRVEDEGYESDDFECSACGAVTWCFCLDIPGEGVKWVPNYCPSCGRKVVDDGGQ